MKRAALTIAAVLAAWTLTAATVRTATETFVTNKIAEAVAAIPAPDYSTNNAALVETIEAKAPAPGNYAAVSNAAMNAAMADDVYTKAEMNAELNGLHQDIAHYGQLAENAVSSVNGKTGNAVTLDAKDIDILMVRGNVRTNIEYAVNGLDIEMGMTFDAIWRSLSGKQDNLPYPTNAIPYAAITGKPTFATVATSGSYDDLLNKPTIPTVPTNVSAFVNDAGYLTSYTETDPVWTAEKSGYATTSALAAKADATNIYTKAQMDAALDGKMNKTGSDSVNFLEGDGYGGANVSAYNTFSFAHPVQDATAGNLAALDASGDLVDSGKSAADFATAGALSAAAQSATNYVNAVAAGKQDTISDLAAIRSGAALGATALQSYTETDPTVPAWAKAASKPAYTYAEITGKPTFATVATSGSYNDLTDKPSIPSPTAPVASATLAWQSNGSAIVVSVGAAGTLSATLTDWIEGQTQTALITIAAGASVSSEVKLVGYGTWPTGGQFLASATRVGNYVYVTPIVLVN